MPDILHSPFSIPTTGACTDNWLQLSYVLMCNTHIQIGDAGSQSVHHNRIEANIHRGNEGSVGLRMFGQSNFVNLNVGAGGLSTSILFEPDARENLVIALNLPQGIINNATTPTNRLITTSPIGYDVPIPRIAASGESVMNRNPYPVEIVILMPGECSGWRLTDAKGNFQGVDAGLSAGQRFILNPGEKLGFTYTTPPTWKWRALQ